METDPTQAERFGSSPRGRGKRGRRHRRATLRRLIPARAGKTPSTAPCGRCARAHPRAGGENAEGWEPGGAIRGSSPRGRGKRRAWFRWAWGFRLIPARAGKTWHRSRPRLNTTAHPRAGGENFLGESGNLSPGGSSPRGRGKRFYPADERQRPGLIPARAGKTRCSRRGWPTRTAHPRAGGENGLAGGGGDDGGGSSPRGRGKPPSSTGAVMPLRLIPARAGKT